MPLRRPARRASRPRRRARDPRHRHRRRRRTVSGGLGAAVAEPRRRARSRCRCGSSASAASSRPPAARRSCSTTSGSTPDGIAAPRTRSWPLAPCDPMLLAIDQGTSATKALLVDADGADRRSRLGARRRSRTRSRAGSSRTPAEIWDSVRAAVADCLGATTPPRVAAVGLSTQRESLVLWDRGSGEPLGPLLSWQDQRTAPHCARLRREGARRPGPRAAAGSPLDPMFSATEGALAARRARPDRARSRRGELCLGTVDSWLLSRLGGEHVIEAGNASRTQLLDVQTLPLGSPSCSSCSASRRACCRAWSRRPARSRPCAASPPLPDGTPVARRDGRLARRAVRPRRLAARPGQGHLRHRLLDHEPRPPPGRTDREALCADDRVGRRARRSTPSRATSAPAARRSRGWPRVLETTPEALAERAAPTQRRRPPRPGVRRPRRAVVGRRGRRADLRAHASARGRRTWRGRRSSRSPSRSRTSSPPSTARSRRSRPCSPTAAPTANRMLMQLQADTGGRARARRPLARALGARRRAPRGRGAGLWDRGTLEAFDRAGDLYTPQEAAPSRRQRVARWHAAVARARARAADEERPRTRA